MQPERRDALAELDVELGLAERRRDLVLDDLHADAVADRLGAVLERLDAADVQALGGVELQRAAARLRLRRAEHDADLLADLVREEAERLRAVEVAGELAHRLGHHPRLQADGLVAHLALELGPRRQRRDGVDRHDVDRAGAHEHVGDLERLLAVVGLRDEQLVDVDADLLGVQRVHRVLGVDERAHAAELLGLGEHVVDERRLARGLRAEDLDDAPARHAADAQREVERERAGRDRVTRTCAPSSPMRMTVPLPNWRSICVSAPCSAASRALAALSWLMWAVLLLQLSESVRGMMGRGSDGTGPAWPRSRDGTTRGVTGGRAKACRLSAGGTRPGSR